jgi:hypothetical protein
MTEKSSRPTPIMVRFLLGVFIIWQLFFLITSNLLGLLRKFRESWTDQPIVQSIVPDLSKEKGSVADFEQGLAKLTARWSELTGQPQTWSLFAPNVTSIIPFVAVEFCWEDDPSSVTSKSRLIMPLGAANPVDEVVLGNVAWNDNSDNRLDPQSRIKLLLEKEGSPVGLIGDRSPPGAPWRRQRKALIHYSENEPTDKQHYFKIGHFRIRRYESNIDIAPNPSDKEPAAVVDAWREEIEGRVRERWRLMHAYLRWQLEKFLAGHPGLPEPRQVILWARIYRVPPPEQSLWPWSWRGPDWHAVARWQPQAKWEDQHLSIEMFNPVVDRFESIRLREDNHHE